MISDNGRFTMTEEENFRASGITYDIIPVQDRDTLDLGGHKLEIFHISGPNKELLRGRLLEREEEVLPLVKEKSMRNGQDHFIENAMFFLIYCKENTSSWIQENYSQFRSEYLKSLFCLVLGFRAGQEIIPFLMTEAKRFEELYPNEYFDQGPTWAVRELYDRFYT